MFAAYVLWSGCDDEHLWPFSGGSRGVSIVSMETPFYAKLIHKLGQIQSQIVNHLKSVESWNPPFPEIGSFHVLSAAGMIVVHSLAFQSEQGGA